MSNANGSEGAMISNWGHLPVSSWQQLAAVPGTQMVAITDYADICTGPVLRAQLAIAKN